MRKRARIHISEGGVTRKEQVEDWLKDWKKPEEAYGHDLTPKVRAFIISAVRDYIDEARDEQEATQRKFVIDRITSLRTAALCFKDALTSRADFQDAQLRVVRVLIQQELRHLVPAGTTMSTITATASKFVTACDRALAAADIRSGFTEGDAWDHLIVTLKQGLKTEGLPVGVSHADNQKNSSSPFVRFIAALQQDFPRWARHHDQVGANSLAKAINRSKRVSGRSEGVRPGSRRKTTKPANLEDESLEGEIFTNATRPRGGH